MRLQTITLNIDTNSTSFVNFEGIDEGTPSANIFASSDFILDFRVWADEALVDLTGYTSFYLAIDTDFDSGTTPYLTGGNTDYTSAQTYLTSDKSEGELAFKLASRGNFLTRLGDMPSQRAYIALWADTDLLLHDRITLKNVSYYD